MVRQIASLAEQVESNLLDQLRQIQPGERFPSEVEIASRFNVSRVTVREALASLERKALITRKQGVGTFVNRNVLQIQTRVDESIEFGKLIRASGHAASVTETQVSTGRPASDVAERLCLTQTDEALILHKVFSADGVPVIYVLNVIPLNLIALEYRDATIHETRATEPLYSFLAERCGQVITYQIADIRAVPAEREVARHLGYRPGAAVLRIEEIGYNAQDVPAFYSQEYYNTDVIQFKLTRKPG